MINNLWKGIKICRYFLLKEIAGLLLPGRQILSAFPIAPTSTVKNSGNYV
jgi:hypothetical protein